MSLENIHKKVDPFWFLLKHVLEAKWKNLNGKPATYEDSGEKGQIEFFIFF